MTQTHETGKVNVKLIVILLVSAVGLVAALFVARHVRRQILAARDLREGNAAYERKDWAKVIEYYREYLGRKRDNLEVWKRYGEANMSIRPIKGKNVFAAIGAYRHVLQVSPDDRATCEKLAGLYVGVHRYDDLAYVAKNRLKKDPDDLDAPVWLGQALLELGKHDEARKELTRFVKRVRALAEKHPQYLDACALLSQVEVRSGPSGSVSVALDWLNQAHDYDPESVPVLLRRASFYRAALDLPEEIAANRNKLAQDDLAAADKLAPSDPRHRLALCSEWMMHGQLDKAASELEAVKGIDEETVNQYYFEKGDWVADRFLRASELALRRGAKPDDAKLADEALETLPEGMNRIRALPNACRLYVAAERPGDARKALDAFLDATKGADDKESAGWRLSPMQTAYLEAWVARAEGRLYRVIDVLEPVTAASPNTPEAWKRLAEAYGRTDQARRAIHALTQYLRLRPRDPEMTLQLAREYLKLQDWNRAFETIRLAEPLDPTDIVIKLLRIEASIYLAVERREGIDQAELDRLKEELKGLRKTNEKRVDIRILQAIIDVHQNHPDQAEKKLKDAIKECDDKLPARMQLVRFYYRTERPDEALKACREACREHPEVAEPWLSLSGLYVSAKDNPQAIQALRDGLATVRDPWEARPLNMRLGRVELLYGQRDAGINVLQGIAERDPNEVRARQLLLDLPETRRDPAQMTRLIGELKAIEGDAGLQWRYYQAVATLGRPDWRSRQPEISQLLDRCIESDPQWSRPVLLLVAMHQRLGNVRQAETLCRDALKRNPSATDVVARLVSLLERQEKYGEAQEIVQRLDANSGARRALNLRLALRKGEYSRAIEELEFRAAGDKQDADSRVLLARVVYWQTKDVTRALKYLDEAESIAPDSIAAMNARVEIYHAEGRDAEARQILDRQVARAGEAAADPDNKARRLFAAYARRGSFLTAIDKMDDAEKDFVAMTKLTGYQARGAEVLGSFYAGTKRLDQAVSVLRGAIKDHPENLSLKQKLMFVLLGRKGKGDEAEADAILAELEGKMPDHPELMRLHALRLLRQGTPEANRQARELLERVVQIEPTSVRSHLLLISAAMGRREYADAARHAIRALGANPNQPLLMLARARAEQAQGNFSMAAELARQVLRNHPDSPDARGVFYEVAVNAGNRSLLDEALAMTERTLADQPDDVITRSWRTRLLLIAKQPGKAIAELEAFCKTTPGSESAASFLDLAEIYRSRGDTAMAERNLQAAEKLARGTPAVVQGRLRLLGTLRKYDDIAAMADKCMQDPAANMDVITTAANVLIASPNGKDREKAVKAFRLVHEKQPWSVDATLGLAGACVIAGRIDEAERLYREVLEGNPDDPKALNDLAWVLTRYRGLHTAALAMAEQGLAIAPTNSHLLDTRGEILSHMPGRLNDAKADFEKVLAMANEGTREQAKALFQLGRLQAKLKDLPEAKRCLTKAMEIDERLSVFTEEERREIAAITRGNPEP